MSYLPVISSQEMDFFLVKPHETPIGFTLTALRTGLAEQFCAGFIQDWPSLGTQCPKVRITFDDTSSSISLEHLGLSCQFIAKLGWEEFYELQAALADPIRKPVIVPLARGFTVRALSKDVATVVAG